MNRTLSQRTLLACLALLLPAALTAAEAPSIACSGLTEPRGPSGLLVAPEEVIFLSLDGLRGGELEVEITVDGAPFVRERIALPDQLDGTKGTPVAGVLATEPKLLHRIHELADDPLHEVETHLWLDGVHQRSLTFDELEAESDRLLSAPFRPQVVDSVVEGPATEQPLSQSAAGSQACQQQCHRAYLDCIEEVCFPEVTCPACENAYQACLDQCPPPDPPPPPTCEEEVEYFWTGWYFVGSFYSGAFICYPDPFFFYEGVWHDELVTVFRRDQIERTTHTDCSTTDQVVGYQYLYTYCWDDSFSPCSNPWTPINTCY